MTIRPCTPFWHKSPSLIQGYCIVLVSYDWHLALNYRGMEALLAGKKWKYYGTKQLSRTG